MHRPFADLVPNPSGFAERHFEGLLSGAHTYQVDGLDGSAAPAGGAPARVHVWARAIASMAPQPRALHSLALTYSQARGSGVVVACGLQIVLAGANPLTPWLLRGVVEGLAKGGGGGA